MSMHLFLYRNKNSNDRDCCKYIENKATRFECGHYFGSVILHGSCFGGGDFDKYEDIETILTEDEYNSLVEYDKQIIELGYCIEKGDERYKRGIALGKDIEYIYNKLRSEEAKAFQEKIIEDEMNVLKEEYCLSDEDIKNIFDNYHQDYRDRSVVGYVFKDSEDLGYEEAWSLGYITGRGDTVQDRYFDYARFGEDLLEEEQYLELADGRCVSLSY